MQGSQTLQLPYHDEQTEAHFRRLSSTFLTMTTDEGINVIWDGNHRIYVKLTPNHKNKVSTRYTDLDSCSCNNSIILNVIVQYSDIYASKNSNSTIDSSQTTKKNYTI